MSELVNPEWPKATIKSTSYLKGRIGWQGLRASEFTDHGPYLITGTDFRDGKIDWSTCYHVTEERFQEASYIHVRSGDLLITKDGTIGKVAFVTDCPEKAVLNSGIFLLRCSDGSYEHRFLYHLLNSHVFEKFLRVNLAGSTISHLYQNVFERFDFPVPDIRLQQRMADILDAIDGQIEQTEALIAKMQQVKAGLMHDLFTRGVTFDGHLRPTREQAPDLYKDSPPGWIPKEWDCLTADQLLAKTACPMRSGPFGSALLKDELVEEGIPFLGIDNIFVERFCPTFRRFVSKRKFQELIRYSVFPRDVIITIMGTVGRCCVVPDHITKALSSKHLWTMTFDTERVLPELVCWQLNHARWVKDWFARYSQGAVMEAIQSSTLRNLKLPIPPIKEQYQIFDRYQACSLRSEAEEKHLDKLRQQKIGLMHDLLTGSVRVPLAKTKEDVAMVPAPSDIEPTT